MRLWLGGYGPDMDGTGSGIGVIHAGSAAEQSARGALAFAATAAEVASPSWLAAHPTRDVIYAALEGLGAVQAFERTGIEALVPFGEPVSTGNFTCHVAVSPDGTALVATAYGDGGVAFIPLDADGALGAAVFGAAPTDPYTGVRAPVVVTDTGFAGLTASGFTLASAPESSAGAGDARASELNAAAESLRAAVGAEFAGLVPSYGADAEDEFARFLASQRVEDDASLAARVAEELIGLAGAGDSGVAESGGAEVVPERAAHAHQARFLANDLVATTDLGFDLVRFWQRSPRGFGEIQQVILPQGSGPRHMVWHPSGHLHVVTEYSCEIFTLARDAAGDWRIVSVAPVSREASAGVDFPAELSASRGGMHLYAGVRGSNTIATLAVKDNGSRLVPVAAVESHVDWPRHHVVVGDVMFVAGQRSSSVAALMIDERTQVPLTRRASAEAPTPTMLLPVFD